MRYPYVFVLAFLCVFILVPLVRLLAINVGFVDRPTARKIHKVPIPLSGGVAIYAGVIITAAVFMHDTLLFKAVATGGALLVLIGLADDAFKSRGRDFPVWPRLILYTIVSYIPYAFGIAIKGVSSPSASSMILFSDSWSMVFTMLWVFALINMLNFIDGVDGLASGITVISSLTLFVASIVSHHEVTSLAALAIAGACLAFLTYNFHPARIFMGDAGATFLGYMLSVIAMDGTLKGATFLSLLVPLLALGVPILDTAIVFARRLLQGKGLHHADNLHTHHSLMKWGLSQVQTVSFLYLIAAVFALLSVVIVLLLHPI